MAVFELVVNGQRRVVDADAQTPLLFVLRELGLASVRLGCGLEQCGACKVIVDGHAVFACARPAAAFVGQAVTTLEGCVADPVMRHLQDAFVAVNAGQCGYCLSGILMAAKALLDRDPVAGDAAVRAALADNLCRCGAQPRILRAIRGAVAAGVIAAT